MHSPYTCQKLRFLEVFADQIANLALGLFCIENLQSSFDQVIVRQGLNHPLRISEAFTDGVLEDSDVGGSLASIGAVAY